MRISLSITTYNRYELTIQSFAKVIEDERIDDVVVLDDASEDGSFRSLNDYFKDNDKVIVRRQITNRGMSLNKAHAIALCKNDFVIIFDSDNIMDKSYIDALEAVGNFKEDTMYLPVGALPHFPYAKYSGQTIDRNNVKNCMGDPMFRCSLNTCNCLVNKDFYAKVFKEDSTIGCADTINHIYNHLEVGGKLYFVPNLTYFHLVGPQSGFMENVSYNMMKAKEIENKIMSL
jgi:glycosyltransferase involved in cell wall biosynthesis